MNTTVRTNTTTTPRASRKPRHCSTACIAALLAASIAAPAPATAGWLDKLKETLDSKSASAPTELTTDEIARGLKSALAQGTERAVTNLGKPDGFLRNLDVRIPLPPSLEKAEKTLHRLGQQKLADDFVTTLNRAAETAVAEAGPIFRDAITQMTLADAKQILAGPDDAATQYFRRIGESRIHERMLPIVRSATDKTGVTSAYKKLTGHRAVAALFRSRSDLQLDNYVTQKAGDGLFKLIADEEKEIRRNPVARTTELLKRVFGSASK
jgi:hypothetical protein